MDRNFLKKIITENGLIDEKRFNEIDSLSLNSNIPLLTTILNGKYISESVLMPLISDSIGLDWLAIDNDDTRLDKTLYFELGKELQNAADILPLFKEKNVIVIGISNPMEIELIDKIKTETGWNTKLILVAQSRLNSIRDFFTEGSTDDLKNLSISEGMDEKSIEDIANEAPVIKRVNLIIMQAISISASDIHIDPYEKEAVVRYRVDGVLKESARYPKNLYPAIISRIKIMADLNIAERRIPQDGRISLNLMDKSYDLRVATIPVLHGEGVVLRILDKSGTLVDLKQIGFDKRKLDIFKRQIKLPYGIILVTGPTGSGKTTTLNATLVSIKGGEKKIITIEDPVEYEVPGVTQIHVNAKVGLTFAAGLRSILRLDPDIVMVGEMRDLETAEIAIRTALTGHLVFSTLHTNDAPSAVTRLVDMGIEPFLISSSINAVMAQRLVRKICKFCKKEKVPTLTAKTLFETSEKKIPAKLFYGAGCDECHNTGYSGRTAIIEFFELSDEIRELVNQRVSTDIIRKAAIKNGMVTMREDGINKILSKITTAEEVLRVTQMD
jgi:type IV pilus assembly protein PilB